MTLIGISGEKFAGKNTASTILIEKYGFKEYSLAQPLKEMVSQVFGLSYESCNDPELKEKPFDKPIEITTQDVFSLIKVAQTYMNIADNARLAMNRKIKDRTFENPRKLLQYVGTELFRDCVNVHFWCKVLDERIKNEAKVVVTDVRFPNEREYIKLKNGTLILINRPNLVKALDTHSTEKSLGLISEYDYVINNKSSKEELANVVETWYNYTNCVRNENIIVVNKEW